MINEQNEEKEETVETEQQNQPPIFDSEDFLKVLEHIEKELKSEKMFRTSIWWYFHLFVQLLFYYGIGISLLVLFKPFRLSNGYVLFIYLGLSTLICGLVKLYTHKSNKPIIKLLDEYINYGLTLVLSVLIAKYIPSIIDIEYALLVIYIFIMLFLSESIAKVLKKHIRGNYGKNK